jgi:hypothetical protein
MGTLDHTSTTIRVRVIINPYIRLKIFALGHGGRLLGYKKAEVKRVKTLDFHAFNTVWMIVTNLEIDLLKTR